MFHRRASRFATSEASETAKPAMPTQYATRCGATAGIISPGWIYERTTYTMKRANVMFLCGGTAQACTVQREIFAGHPIRRELGVVTVKRQLTERREFMP